MNLKEAQALDAAHLFQNYKRAPLLLAGGRGCVVFGDDGRAYLDFVTGIGVNALGHGDDRVVSILREAADSVLHTSNLYHHPFAGPVAERLKRLSGLDRVFFANSGTEVVEAALKLARARAKKRGEGERVEVLAFEGSFHGRTFGALSATSTEKYRAPFEPLVPGFRFLPYGDAAGVASAVGPRTAAVIVECVQGEGGLAAASPEFVRAIRAAGDGAGAALIADEVQCGLGRTGRPFAFQKSGVLPDLVTVAKPLGLGLPLGALLARESWAGAFAPGDHGTTFGGNPLACRLAIEFLDRLLGGLPEVVAETGRYFRARLESLAASTPGVLEVRGEGLMLGLVLAFDAAPVVERALEAGFLINRTAGTVLRFLPPFVVGRPEIDRLVEGLAAAIAASTPTPSAGALSRA
ncbi:MAG TPA: acetylornithine/succinylornithine family transaminase [Planctomycetota bacterium]|nr:acetylornithine/succinylornithine family transaminase [Planctomycetota bacterium]